MEIKHSPLPWEPCEKGDYGAVDIGKALDLPPFSILDIDFNKRRCSCGED